MQWLQHGAGLINRREKRGEKNNRGFEVRNHCCLHVLCMRSMSKGQNCNKALQQYLRMAAESTMWDRLLCSRVSVFISTRCAIRFFPNCKDVRCLQRECWPTNSTYGYSLPTPGAAVAWWLRKHTWVWKVSSLNPQDAIPGPCSWVAISCVQMCAVIITSSSFLLSLSLSPEVPPTSTYPDFLNTFMGDGNVT